MGFRSQQWGGIVKPTNYPKGHFKPLRYPADKSCPVGTQMRQIFHQNTQQTNNALLHLKTSHFSSLSSTAGLSGKYLQNLFSNQRPPSIICFPNRKFTQGNTHTFFFSFERLGKYIYFIKRKKNFHLGEGWEGWLGVLAISTRSILVFLSLFLSGLKVLWYYEKQQKAFT